MFESDGTSFILLDIFNKIFESTPVAPLLSFPFSGLYLDQVPSNHSIFGL